MSDSYAQTLAQHRLQSARRLLAEVEQALTEHETKVRNSGSFADASTAGRVVDALQAVLGDLRLATAFNPSARQGRYLKRARSAGARQ